MVARRVNITLVIKYEIEYMGFRLSYLNLTLTYSKGQLGSWNGVLQLFWLSCYDRSSKGKPEDNQQISEDNFVSIRIWSA